MRLILLSLIVIGVSSHHLAPLESYYFYKVSSFNLFGTMLFLQSKFFQTFGTSLSQTEFLLVGFHEIEKRRLWIKFFP